MKKLKMVIKITGSRKGLFLPAYDLLHQFFGCFSSKCDEGDQGLHIKVMQKIAATRGVLSVTVKGDTRDKVEVVGEGIDAAKLIQCLRKKVGHVDIESLEEVKDNKEEKPKEQWTSICYPAPPFCEICYPAPPFYVPP